MKTLLEKISRLKILVIGDIVLDHYIWGDSTRISQEAPVPVVGVERDTYTAGAAANVALNLTALGAAAELCGIIGEDDAGRRLREILKQQSVPIDECFINPRISTILKTRVIVRHQQLCRLDREETPSKYGIDLEKQLPGIEEKVRAADAVILSDYAKGVITADLIAAVQKVAREKGVPVAYDPKPKRRLDFDAVDLMTPNKTEALDLAGIELERHEEFPSKEVCEGIWKRHRPKHLVITLGADGMLLCEEGRMQKRIPTYAREVFDVSGAGDTVIATLTAALAAGASMAEAAHLANTAAGVVVGKLGTASATPPEILDYEAAHESG